MGIGATLTAGGEDLLFAVEGSELEQPDSRIARQAPDRRACDSPVVPGCLIFGHLKLRYNSPRRRLPRQLPQLGGPRVGQARPDTLRTSSVTP
jgi:hypothetical protein